MAETTQVSPPPKGSGGGDKTIMGLPIKTAVIVGAVAVVGGYLYIKNKQQQQGQGQGGTQPRYQSPTGLTREDIHIWIKDNQGHKGKGKGK
jgi:hypothetical protein